MKVKGIWARMRTFCTRAHIRSLIATCRRVLLNPRLLLCLVIAWMITNGWSYILFALGLILKIDWMYMVGGAYLSLLWLPFTPEKLVTVLIAIGLMQLLYPRDERTLAFLKQKMAALRRRKAHSGIDGD